MNIDSDLNNQRIEEEFVMSFQQVTTVERPTGAWVNFSYASFAASILMVGGGIAALPLYGWVRA